MRRIRPRARAMAATVACLAVAGCSTEIAGQALPEGSQPADRGLVTDYFTELNAAGEDGADVQAEYLRRTQHPDYTDRLCDLSGLTLEIEPAMSTLRTDPDWVPPESTGGPPRGTVYVLGVSVRIRQQGAMLGEQIGSQRVVIVDGEAYGFSPCPTGR